MILCVDLGRIGSTLGGTDLLEGGGFFGTSISEPSPTKKTADSSSPTNLPGPSPSQLLYHVKYLIIHFMLHIPPLKKINDTLL